MIIVLGIGGHARMLAAIAARAGQTTPTLLDFLETPSDGADLLNGVGNAPKIGEADLRRRAEIYEKYKSRMRTAVDPSAIVLGECAGDVFPGAIINIGAQVGANAIINTGALIEHDCIIGPHSHIGPGAVLCGNVEIGEMTHIGARAVIKQGIKIGSGCVVAIGAAVFKDLPDGATLLSDGRTILRSWT